MSLAEGINLGLQLSRGSREEVRRDEMIARQQAQQDRDNAYQDQLRPLQIQASEQSLAAAKAQQAHLAELAPVQLQGLRDAQIYQKNQDSRAAEILEIEKSQSSAAIQAEQARAKAYKDQSRIATEEHAERKAAAVKAEKAAWVQSQAGIEFSRFTQGQGFSDRFLQTSEEIGSPLSPARFLDTKYVNALDTLNNMLDPKRPESVADKSGLMGALNVVLDSQINSGPAVAPNGSPIKKREISDIHPVMQNGKVVPGKYYVNLLVTPEQGEPYSAPLTLNRSSSPDDPVKAVDLGDVVNMARSQKFFAQAINADPAASERLKAQYARANKSTDADTIEWGGSKRKFADVLSMYKEDKTLHGPDGGPLVSFSDFEWSGGDPSKMDHVRRTAQQNQQTQDQINAALANGDQELAARLNAKIISAPDVWRYAEQARQAQDKKNEAAKKTLQGLKGSQQDPFKSISSDDKTAVMNMINA